MSRATPKAWVWAARIIVCHADALGDRRKAPGSRV